MIKVHPWSPIKVLYPDPALGTLARKNAWASLGSIGRRSALPPSPWAGTVSASCSETVGWEERQLEEMVGEVRAKLHISFAILEISSIFQNEVSVRGCTSRVLGQHVFCVICETCMYSHVMPCQLVGKLRCSNFWEHQTVPHGATLRAAKWRAKQFRLGIIARRFHWHYPHKNVTIKRPLRGNAWLLSCNAQLQGCTLVLVFIHLVCTDNQIQKTRPGTWDKHG